MKMAIIQNRIGIDGRSAVVSEFIKVCNGYGIVPIAFSFSSFGDAQIFKGEYGQNLDFELARPTRFPFQRGTAYQTPLLNMMAYSRVRGFDVVFNSGRCPHFLPIGPTYIHYVHFPVETSLEKEEHFKSAVGKAYTLPLKILYAGRAKKVRNGIFLANSRFTEKEILSLYTSLAENQVKVVYPPCKFSDEEKAVNRDLDFVSLGSFVSDKRQLEQLEIAKQLREYKFSLIGGIKSKKYFDRCASMTERLNLNNVRLYPNAKKKQIHDLLSRSKVFLHTRRSEHFGIATVEAISHGCIPIVHDSGGSREIVPFEELRFKNTGEAVDAASRMVQTYFDKSRSFMPKLAERIIEFSCENFRNEMRGIVFEQKTG